MNVRNTQFLQQNKQAIFAISDADYATMALTMFDSVTRFYPDADFFLFIIGTGEVTKINDNINVVYIADVMDDLDLSQRLVHYLQVELVTSVRPHCAEFLFAKQYERAIYLDPDVYVFRRMTEVDDLLDGDCNGIVTAHSLHSISDGALVGGDNVFLKCGIFNMGFFALKNTPETARMLAWWKEKLKWKCIVDWPNGYFVDQKWLEFLPVYFDGFHILKLPTYNLAPWNAEHYEILRDSKNNFFVNDLDTPVAFIHFSGISRMEEHFLYMKGARRFYIKELQKRKFQKLDFSNYEVRFKGTGLLFDKVCAFLYKDYVKKSKDEKSNPLVSRWFYDYIHSTDEETGFPIYIKKLYEILPDIFVGYRSTKLTINWDNIIWLVKNHFSYDSVASLETMIQLSDSSKLSSFSVLHPETIDKCPLAKSPYGQAVLSFCPPTQRHEQATQSQTVIFKPDRIELQSGTVRVCIPELDSSGNLPIDCDLRSERYSEIWVPSAFCKSKLAINRGLLNVTPMLPPVLKTKIVLENTGLPPQKFVVLLRHDFHLDFAAQDSLAGIHAFKEAFDSNSDALLVCFLANVEGPSDSKSIVSAAAGTGNIMVVENSDAMYYSYLHRANCFISLHHETAAAGALAEAMSLGKEVIATSVGASSHYLNSENSFSIRPVSALEVIEKAAKALRDIHNGTDVVGAKGRKAKLFANKHLSAQSVGYAMQKRIEELHTLQTHLEQSRSIPARFVRKIRRMKMRFLPSRIPTRDVSPPNPEAEQTEAIIKILLKNVVRPSILE